MARSWTIPLLVAALSTLAGGCEQSARPESEDASGGDAGPPLGCMFDLDGDSILDAHEGSDDPDGDGRSSSIDEDSDGDGALDRLEAGDRDCASPPIDTDSDGIPDFLDRDGNGDYVEDGPQHDRDTDADGVRDAIDLDVDGDTLQNEHERGPGPEARDRDDDGTPDVHDLDSDSDGIPDRDEAGDLDPATPPIHCAREEAGGDGAFDASDLDRDDDGLADGEELAWGTNPCAPDTDSDGLGDLLEHAYERTHCADRVSGIGCGCASSASCSIPPDAIVVALAFGEAPIERTIEVAVSTRRADVFFALDTTASMDGTLANIQSTISRPATGIVARVTETIPDAWFGLGQIEDFPFSSYGGAGDTPFRLELEMSASPRAITMELHGGGDGPEAHVEALYRIVTGLPERWSWAGMTHAIPDYRGDCVIGRWGAPCFREGALPVIVLFTDVCSHMGPRDDDLVACGDYFGIAPSPIGWDETIAQLENRSVTFVGVNAAEAIMCAGTPSAGGTSPCWFLHSVARETGSVDVGGDPLVFDLPDDSTSGVFIDTIAAAIDAAATRVRRDVDAQVRDDRIGPGARRFVASIGPACDGATPCWLAPLGTPHEEAVVRYDAASFSGVVPGTRLLFRVRLANALELGGSTALVARAEIEFRADRAEVIATHEIIAAVPADDGIMR